MSENRLRTLLGWVEAQGIRIDAVLNVVDDKNTGISVFATADIPSLSTVVTIPKTALLSARTCLIAEHLDSALHGHAAHLTLALALYSEILRELDSHWFGYLQSLPYDGAPIALFWGQEDTDDDGRAAREWLAHTDTTKEFRSEDDGFLVDEILRYYDTDVDPLLSRLSLKPRLSGYLRAYSLVSSRAFLVDSYHGLCMVPVADAFNHVNDNHVHLESNFDVCPICGSFAECPHDLDETCTKPEEPRTAHPRTGLPARYVGTSDPDTCDMVTNRFVPAGSEVFNTYGQLSNAALLARYGFLLEGNENDYVSWYLVDLVGPDSGSFFEDAVRSSLRSRWPLAMEDSTLVFRYVDGVSSSAGNKRLLQINSDAQVNLHLWIWAAFSTLRNRGEDLGSDLTLLQSVVNVQLELEAAAGEMEDGVEVEIELSDAETPALEVLSGIAQTILGLCERRLAKQGAFGGIELGVLLDALPPDRPKTRLAITYLMNECALLQSCASAWTEILALAKSASPRSADF